jgi:hypothetical protein
MTAQHIRRVGELMVNAAYGLSMRAVNHDASKWSAEEWKAFARETPGLKGLTYGSEEYKAALARLGPSLQHHYAANPHHPEHHRYGVNSMTLVDLIEMLCDWKAATERHTDGNLARSIEQNAVRFGIDKQLERILSNTADSMGFLQYPEDDLTRR